MNRYTIGDKAVQVITDAYIAAQRNNPMPLHRHYLIHADNLGDHDDLFRAMRNGIGVSVQTNLQSFVYEVSMERCGERKGKALMPSDQARRSGGDKSRISLD